MSNATPTPPELVPPFPADPRIPLLGFSYFLNGAGAFLSFMALSEVFSLKIPRVRFWILITMILSSMLANLAIVGSTNEFYNFRNYYEFKAAYVIFGFSQIVPGCMILWHYSERLLIIVNRVSWRRYIPICFMTVIPMYIYTLIPAVRTGEVNNIKLWIPILMSTYSQRNITIIWSSISKLYTICIDVYIVYRLQRIGIRQHGFNWTRISRLFLCLIFNMFCLVFSTSAFQAEVGLVRMSLTAMIFGLDSVVIVDFFVIDLNPEKSFSAQKNQSSHQKSGQTAPLQTAALSKA